MNERDQVISFLLQSIDTLHKTIDELQRQLNEYKKQEAASKDANL